MRLCTVGILYQIACTYFYSVTLSVSPTQRASTALLPAFQCQGRGKRKKGRQLGMGTKIYMYSIYSIYIYAVIVWGKTADHLCLLQDINVSPHPPLTSNSASGKHGQRVKTHLFTRAKAYVDDDVLKIVINTFSQSAGASHALVCTWPWVAAGGTPRLPREKTVTTPCCQFD